MCSVGEDCSYLFIGWLLKKNPLSRARGAKRKNGRLKNQKKRGFGCVAESSG